MTSLNSLSTNSGADPLFIAFATSPSAFTICNTLIFRDCGGHPAFTMYTPLLFFEIAGLLAYDDDAQFHLITVYFGLFFYHFPNF